jgi:hypothetical protein
VKGGCVSRVGGSSRRHRYCRKLWKKYSVICCHEIATTIVFQNKIFLESAGNRGKINLETFMQLINKILFSFHFLVKIQV